MMGLEYRVCSLELAKRIKELRAVQESVFAWYQHPNNELHPGYILIPNSPDLWKSETDFYAAFTSAELGEMLPGDDTVASRKLNSSWRSILYDFRGLNHYFTQDKTEANARAKMLIYLLEKGLVKP